MKTITRQQVEAIFAAIQGCAFVGITTTTEPRLKGGKSNPHKGRVKKHTTASVFCGKAVNYKSMLENKAFKQFRESEGIDLAADQIEIVPMQVEGLWKGKGEKLDGAVVRHVETDARYVGVYYPKSENPEVAKKFKPTVNYTLDGEPIAKEDIEGLVESKATSKQVTVKVTNDDGSEETREITIKVVPRVYKMHSLVAFRHNGESYEIAAEVEGGEIAEATQPETAPQDAEQQA